MTTTLGTDANNDIYLDSSNNVAILNGLPAIVKACETATKAQLGEMVLATGLGIPNFQTVWNGNPNFSLFESFLRDTILSVDGVDEVVSLQLRTLNNTLSYTATIRTAFGAGDING